MNLNALLEDNQKLVDRFGAQRIQDLSDVPDFYTFKNGLIFSHRDFDTFYAGLKKGKRSAIVSGFNASGTMHIGHKAVFDTNLFFQKKYGLPVFIPISDDESYVSGKVESQEDALKNSMQLAKEMLAYGFDPQKTYIVIDQIYTTIYNLAIKLSKRLTVSEVRATYGYRMENNPGLFFYPCIQAAHILLPLESFNFEQILVPIGPDEDSHIRICRDLAGRFGYAKPAVLHVAFMPGTDGSKMSKSRNNMINLQDDEKIIRKRVSKAFSGGAITVEEHRKNGGDPTKDISFFYLSKYFLNQNEANNLASKYQNGELLSGEMKKMLADKLVEFTTQFKKNLSQITEQEIKKVLLSKKETGTETHEPQ
ncbi:MAG: tryptophan--tRNA ligase [Candidatus Micrarchaeota archaeon]